MTNNQSESQRGFDAVAESRRWKEAVSAETADMTIRERMAWFRRQSSVPTIREQSQSAEPELLLREEPLAYSSSTPKPTPPPVVE